MSRPYKINLCTFMGRQGNLEILLPYVDRALEINAIDHYYMIDMTRCDSDHMYIHDKQQELDTKYPGRVHLVNHDIRRRQLKNGTWKETLGLWEPFYRFCETFKDDDIVIKCDLPRDTQARLPMRPTSATRPPPPPPPPPPRSGTARFPWPAHATSRSRSHSTRYGSPRASGPFPALEKPPSDTHRPASGASAS